MLLSAVYVLVVAQSSSEIPEGLMNNPVYKKLCLFNCVRLYDFESRNSSENGDWCLDVFQCGVRARVCVCVCCVICRPLSERFRK